MAKGIFVNSEKNYCLDRKKPSKKIDGANYLEKIHLGPSCFQNRLPFYRKFSDYNPD